MPRARSSPAAARPRQPKPSSLAVASHEIRGPLAAVQSIAELMAVHDLGPDAARLLELLRVATSQAMAVADNLITESALSLGRLRLDPAPVNPAAVLAEVAAVYAPALAREDRSISVEIDPDLPATIVTDPLRFRQVLYNLATNAVRSGSASNVVLRLGPSARPQRLTVSVEDDGPGLPEDFAVAPFARGSGSAGTGLGLWIARDLVKALGGTLLLRNRPEGGAAASFTLHADLAGGRRRRRRPAATHKDASMTSDTGPDGNDVSEGERPLRALVIDDSHVARMLMTTILESFGLEVDTAADSGEAVDRIETARPDVIFLDWALRQEQGADVIDQIVGATRVLPPTIVVSADDGAPADPRIDAFLRKPFTPRELYATMSAVLLGEAAGSASG